jgi:polyphenol oxidase
VIGLITERRAGGEVPLWVHPGWATRFPWLVQGTTGRGSGESAFDLGLSGGAPIGVVLARWAELGRSVGCSSLACSRQVHGVELQLHSAPAAPGLLLMEGWDGHLTDQPALALTVTVADCVPVFLVDADRRAASLLHAGWRGIAAGILERGVRRLARVFGSDPSSLWVHLGPSICGECYQVGDEVVAALGPGSGASDQNPHVDLRSVLATRALRLDIAPERISRSTHCTRCTPGPDIGNRPFFSHRAGDPERQVGVLAVRPH